MKITVSAWLTGLALMSLGCPVRAALLDDVCGLVYRQLSSVPNLDLTKSTGSFKDNGRSYRGCIVRLEGDRARIKDSQYPGPLFYPSEGSALYQQVCVLSDFVGHPDEIHDYVQKRVPTFRLRYSKTVGSKYFANKCPGCGSLSGELILRQVLTHTGETCADHCFQQLY
jgi:hypothetical protein